MDIFLRQSRHFFKASIYLLLAFFAAISSGSAFSDGQKKGAENFAVIYPEVRAPFTAIFREIINGIDEQLEKGFIEISLPQKITLDELEKQLKANHINSAIVLGSRGLRLAAKINGDRKIVSGAAISTPQTCPANVSCLSMLLSPEKMLEQLKKLAPQVKSVHVVYNKERDNWLIEMAVSAAKDLGITINAVAAGNLHANAEFYRDTVNALGNTDALWLLQRDPALRDKNLIEVILEGAWKRDFVVFSSNPTHAKKGALFAMYPNNRELGKSLAEIALSQVNGKTYETQPLTNLNTAINLRTAGHLELNISRDQEETFNLIFPSR